MWLMPGCWHDPGERNKSLNSQCWFEEFSPSILDFCQNSENIWLLFIDEKLEVVSFNTAFSKRLPTNLHVANAKITDFLIAESVSLLEECLGKASFQVRLTFNLDQFMPETIMVNSIRHKGGWLIMGEPGGVSGDEALKRISSLNNELANLNRELVKRNRQLEDARKKIRVLGGLLPICSYCKAIRDDEGYWKKLESFITQNSEAVFSHGICPKCFLERFPDFEENDKIEP